MAPLIFSTTHSEKRGSKLFQTKTKKLESLKSTLLTQINSFIHGVNGISEKQIQKPISKTRFQNLKPELLTTLQEKRNTVENISCLQKLTEESEKLSRELGVFRRKIQSACVIEISFGSFKAHSTSWAFSLTFQTFLLQGCDIPISPKEVQENA